MDLFPINPARPRLQTASLSVYLSHISKFHYIHLIQNLFTNLSSCRQDILGKLDSPVSRLFNRLEEKWFERYAEKHAANAEKHIVCDLRERVHTAAMMIDRSTRRQVKQMH